MPVTILDVLRLALAHGGYLDRNTIPQDAYWTIAVEEAEEARLIETVWVPDACFDGDMGIYEGFDAPVQSVRRLVLPSETMDGSIFDRLRNVVGCPPGSSALIAIEIMIEELNLHHSQSA